MSGLRTPPRASHPSIICRRLGLRSSVAADGGRFFRRLKSCSAIAASSSGNSPDRPPNRVVLGCSLVTLDYLATVDGFPQPDDKIRTRDLQIKGGGNAGNALTCAARLGLSTRIITKVADDSHGKIVLSELEAEGIDTSNVMISSNGNTTFVYIIVDNNTKTRTCFITSGFPPMVVDDLPKSGLLHTLHGVDLVYCDGYSDEVALVVAKKADEMNIPILLDAEPERKKSELDGLLNLASYIVCSEKFPQKWTTMSSISYALLSILLQYPRVKFIVVTLGENGCMMLERNPQGQDYDIHVEDIEDVVQALKGEVPKDFKLPICISSKNMKLSAIGVGEISGRLYIGTAERIPSPELVDTTGCGDAFIGAMLYGLCQGMPFEKMLPFSCQVAAIKCRAIGARTGLPHQSDSRLAPYLHFEGAI